MRVPVHVRRSADAVDAADQEQRLHTLYGRWFNLALDTWSLAIESGTVIALRTARAASGGDPYGSEARLMVREKAEAAVSQQLALATGRYGSDPATAARHVVRAYRRKVRANRRRLLSA